MWSQLIQKRLLLFATNSKSSFRSAAKWVDCTLPDPLRQREVIHIFGAIRKIDKEDDPRNLFEIAGHVITMGEVTLGYLQNELQLLTAPETGQKEIWSKPLHVFAELPNEDDEFIPYMGKFAEEWNLQHVEFYDDDVLEGVLIVDDELFQLCEVSKKSEEQLAILRYFLLEHPLSQALRQVAGNEKSEIVSQLVLSPEKKRLLVEFLADDNLATSILYFLAYYARIVRNKEHDRLESVIYDFNREVKEKKLCRKIEKLDIQIFLSLLEEDIWLTDAYLVQDNDEWEVPIPRWHAFLATVADVTFVKSQRTFNDAVVAGKIAITKDFCWSIPNAQLKSLIKRLKKDGSDEAKRKLIGILNFGEVLLTVKERDSICKTIFEEGVFSFFEELAQSSPDSYLRWFAGEYHGFRFIVDARTHTNEE